MDAPDKLIELVRKVVLRLFPELAGRYHVTARAKVISTQGGLHLAPLTNDGNVDPAAPAIKCDPVPVTLAPGNVVGLGFRYGDPSEPFVQCLSTAALGTYTGSTIDFPGYGSVTDFIMAAHLSGIEVGSQVAAVPIEEGKRFVVLAKI